MILDEFRPKSSSEEINAMAAAPSIDLSGWMSEHLELRSMLSTFVEALMGAEADAICGAGYGQRSAERTNTRNGYRGLVGAVLAEQHDEWTEMRHSIGLDILARCRDHHLESNTDHAATCFNHHAGGRDRGYAPQVPQQIQPPMPDQQSRKGSGLAVAAFVLGIIALVFSWIPFLNVISILLGLVGLGLGVPALIGALRGRRSGKGMAIAGVVLSLVAVVAAIAISAAATEAVDDALSGTDVSTSSGKAAGNTGSDSDAKDDGVYTFGETVTFDDGSTLTVEAPVPFKPDKFSAGGEGFPAHVKYRATFTNNTDEVFDPSLTDGNVTSGGVEGDSVFQDGLDAPDNPVLPGKSVSWWMGYGVQDPADTQLTVRLGFLDYNDVTFTP